MAGKPVCLVCQKEMIRGFMTDQGHLDPVNVPRWCQGAPEPYPAGRQQQFQKGFQVVAYRCPECEALRLYAPSNPS